MFNRFWYFEKIILLLSPLGRNQISFDIRPIYLLQFYFG